MTRDQIASLVISNTSTALTCFAWMDYFFRLVGDFIPNMDEIHLEPCQISEIYAEYVEDRKWAGECSKCVVTFFIITCLYQVRTHYVWNRSEKCGACVLVTSRFAFSKL